MGTYRTSFATIDADDAYRKIVRVYGGHPGETQEQKGRRYKRQVELFEAWPELHEVLMAAIGLQPSGAPLDFPRDEG